MGTNDITKFLGELSASGVRLWASAGKLQFRAPPGVMTSALRAALSQRKRELLAVLGGPEFQASGPPGWTPILRHHRGYWAQLRAGAFDIGFINGTHWIVKCQGSLDARLLGDRVASLASRHSILRARVVERDEVGFVFDLRPESVLEVVDLPSHSGCSPAAVRAVADELVWRSFDPCSGPMARVLAIRLNAGEYLLGLVVHHFICDGMSLEILSRELLSGPSSREPALQYSDYIRGMSHWLGEWGPRHRLEYWRARMQAAPVTRLQPDFECDPEAMAELVVDRITVPARVAEALHGLARRRQTTIFTTVLAAKMCALSCLLGTPDIVVLIQHHHRDDPILLGVVGALTDRLPVRARISVERSCEENLTRVHEALTAAYMHDVPLSLIEEELCDSGACLIAPALNFVNSTARSQRRAGNDGIEPFRVTPAAKFGSARKHSAHWMNLVCDGSGIHGRVGYSPLLYRRETFARFLEALCGAMEGFAEHSERAVMECCNRKPGWAPHGP